MKNYTHTKSLGHVIFFLRLEFLTKIKIHVIFKIVGNIFAQKIPKQEKTKKLIHLDANDLKDFQIRFHRVLEM